MPEGQLQSLACFLPEVLCPGPVLPDAVFSQARLASHCGGNGPVIRCFHCGQRRGPWHGGDPTDACQRCTIFRPFGKPLDISLANGYDTFCEVTRRSRAPCGYEESPSTIGQGCRLTAGGGDSKESATETDRRFILQGWKGEVRAHRRRGNAACRVNPVRCKIGRMSHRVARPMCAVNIA